MNHALIRKTASKRTGLAIARFGQPGSVWRSAGPFGVGASLTIREQSSREAVLRHRLLRHQGPQVRRLILGFPSQDQNFL